MRKAFYLLAPRVDGWVLVHGAVDALRRLRQADGKRPRKMPVTVGMGDCLGNSTADRPSDDASVSYGWFLLEGQDSVVSQTASWETH